MKIERTDDAGSKIVAEGLPNEHTAVHKCFELADAVCESLPNNPKIDVAGPGEIAVFIGLYKQVSFKVLD